jgi:phosphomannomutase
MAARHGVHSAETFTGFKWIAHTVLEHPQLRFLFGYEQALGYLVTDRPLDKDGITAGILMAEVAAPGGGGGCDAAGPLDAIAAEYGQARHCRLSLRMTPPRPLLRSPSCAPTPRGRSTAAPSPTPAGTPKQACCASTG